MYTKRMQALGAVTSIYNKIQETEKREARARAKASRLWSSYIMEKNLARGTSILEERGDAMDEVHRITDEKINLSYQLIGAKRENKQVLLDSYTTLPYLLPC